MVAVLEITPLLLFYAASSVLSFSFAALRIVKEKV
jgi:hypothetical protein